MGADQKQKNGQINIFAKNIRGVSKGETLLEAQKVKNTTRGGFYQNGNGGGVNNDKNKPRKTISVTEVKTIICETNLEDGAENDGSGKITKKGIVHGHSYTFKVTEYTNGEPKDKSKIKWMVGYQSPADSQNKWIENNLSRPEEATGERITITFGNNTDMCGTNLVVKAYIVDKEGGGTLPIWKHNRFRWFDGKVFEDELKERVDNKKPWLINQSGTSLCGMACIFYLFAKEQPDAYKKFAKNLFRRGEAIFNQYTVKPTKELLDKNPNEKGFPRHWDKILKQYVNMPSVDFVTMAGTRNTDNNSYKGGDEEFQAINWPPLMTGLCEELLGYKDVSSDGVYNPIKKSEDYYKPTVWKMIEDINQQINNGYRMIFMIDSDLISEDEDTIRNMFAFEYHWVVLETPIRTIQNLNGEGKIFYTLDFKVYTWGSKDEYLEKEITLGHFIHNYYGYVKAK